MSFFKWWRRGESNPNGNIITDEQNVHKSDTLSPQTRTDIDSPDDTPSLTGDKSDTLSPHKQNTVSQKNYAVFRTKLETEAPDLAKVVDAWPELPEPIRAAILALVQSTERGR